MDHFPVLTRIVFRYSYGFYLIPVLAWTLPFFGNHTDWTLFRYSTEQFFDIRTSSTLSRYSPGFYNFRYSHIFDPFLELTQKVFRYTHGFYIFPVLARILPFSGTHTHSNVFRYSFRQIFGTRTDSTFSRYSPGFYHFSELALIGPFFGSHPNSFSILARLLPFPGTRPDSTIFRYSHSLDPFPVLFRILRF